MALIVLYVGTQLASSAVTAFSADQTQRRIMLALPFVFAVFIINFPAGLIVYWITTNIWTIGQQLVVKKLFPKPEPIARERRRMADKPARGKPPRRNRPRPRRRSPSGKGGKARRASAGSGNGGPARPPPPSPRKKKKRSGRRR